MASVIVLSAFVIVVASVVISVVIGSVGKQLVEEAVLLLVLIVLSVLVSGFIGVFVSVVGVLEELKGVVEEEVSGGQLGKLSTVMGILLSILISSHPEVWMNKVDVVVVTLTNVLVVNVFVTVFKTVLVALIKELHISMNGRKMENMGNSCIGRPEKF